MSRRCWLALPAALMALGGSLAGPAAAADTPTIAPLTSVKFPDRAYALTLPAERRLVDGDVEVRENGEPVASPSVTPADQAGTGSFGMVLVIDASISMRGKPIAGAMTAARTFAARRRAAQRLGVITFDEDVTVALPLTTDARSIDDALTGEPALGRGTAIRDASLAAVKLLRDAKERGGSVVVLSDGDDIYSTVGMEAVLDAARDAGVRIFTVGLESRSYRAGTLEDLAEGSGGTYGLASSPRRLDGIFDRLGAVLSRQYLLRYRSLEQPERPVTVEVRVRGEEPVNARYTTPPLGLDASPPFRRSLESTFWLSPVAVLAISLACAMLVGLTVLLVLRNRGGGLLDRVRHFVSYGHGEGGEDDGSSPGDVGSRKRRESSLSGVKLWERLREDLDVARLEITAERLSLIVLLGTFAVTWTVPTISGTPATAVIGLTVPIGARMLVSFKAQRQRKAFEEQLADNVQVIASAMRAGHSFVGALSVVTEEAPEPSRREFQRVVHDERLGKPIEEAFTDAARRMRNDELDHVGLVARLQTQTGGNTAEVLDQLVDTLRSRADMRRLVRTLTAQGRLGGWVVSALPVVVLLALTILSPTYADKIFGTDSGRIMLVMSTVLIALGSLAIRRIVDIKV
jgi:tight adherence protein B